MISDIVDKIDAMIEDMKRERRRVQSARVNSGHHSNWVTSKLNEIVREQANLYPDDPVKSLGAALSSVPDTISRSFKNLDSIENNISVTIDAYTRVKSEIISFENKKKQELAKEKDLDLISDTEKDTRRKPGARPANKLSERKKKTRVTKKETKPTTRKKKTGVKSEASTKVS